MEASPIWKAQDPPAYLQTTSNSMTEQKTTVVLKWLLKPVFVEI